MIGLAAGPGVVGADDDGVFRAWAKTATAPLRVSENDSFFD